MANIRYVCLSDLHLGEEGSLLTALDTAGEADPMARAPVLQHFAACLAGLLPRDQKPTLLLNGDLIELALAPIEKSLMSFERFLEVIMPPGGELFREIIFVPGNHDHHFWQVAREAQYLKYLASAPAPLQAPWSTTKVFMNMAGEDRLASSLLSGIAQRRPNLRDFEVLIGYPNFGVSANGRAVVVHHGHFIEPVYRAMSIAFSLAFPELEPPADIYQLELENSAWIDFFWSAQGSCGDTGAGIERIYDATNDNKALRAIADQLASSIAKRYDVPFKGPEFLKKLALKTVLDQIADQFSGGQERQKRETCVGKPLSGDARTGLEAYIRDYLRKQIEHEAGSVPERTTFVFGHTHKPYEDLMKVPGVSGAMPVLNTGGWVVDTTEFISDLGAAAILIDEELNAVSLRVYNEGAWEVSVAEPITQGAANSAFAGAVRAQIAATPAPWRELSGLIQAEAKRRKEDLRRRIAARAPAK